MRNLGAAMLAGASKETRDWGCKSTAIEIYLDGTGVKYDPKEFNRPLTRTFWSAFLDGFSMAGLGRRLRIPYSSVPEEKQEKKPVIPLTHFRYLSPEAVQHLADLMDRCEARQARYANLGMICGTFLFALCVSGFVYLIMHGHDVAAGALLAIAALGFLSRLFRAHL